MSNETTPPPDLAARVTELEMLFTHLQQTVQELNGVLLEQGRSLDQLSAQLARLASEYAALSANPPVERNPLDERPPHY